MTTHRYKAAVIIPSRGGAEILHYPLDALAEQTEKDFQVIVVLSITARPWLIATSPRAS